MSHLFINWGNIWIELKNFFRKSKKIYYSVNTKKKN